MILIVSEQSMAHNEEKLKVWFYISKYEEKRKPIVFKVLISSFRNIFKLSPRLDKLLYGEYRTQ